MIKAESKAVHFLKTKWYSNSFSKEKQKSVLNVHENFNMNELANHTLKISLRNTVGIQRDSPHLCVTEFSSAERCPIYSSFSTLLLNVDSVPLPAGVCHLGSGRRNETAQLRRPQSLSAWHQHEDGVSLTNT